MNECFTTVIRPEEAANLTIAEFNEGWKQKRLALKWRLAIFNYRSRFYWIKNFIMVAESVPVLII